MGLGIYKKSLLLLTNTSEDVIIKSKAIVFFCFYTTKHIKCVKISKIVGNLYTADISKQRTLGVRPKLSVIWRFHCTCFKSLISIYREKISKSSPNAFPMTSNRAKYLAYEWSNPIFSRNA